MKTPISWIQAYVPDLHVETQEFIDKMTLSGSYVEGYEKKDKNLENIVVGKILSMEKHPDADKLVVCQVDVGDSTPIQIVTGAKNVQEGDIVPIVLDGGKIAGGHDGSPMPEDGIPIKKGKLRGIESNGMMCGIAELGSTRDFYPEAPMDGVYVFEKNEAVKPGDDAINALGLRDTVVEYEITSNRMDCFSVIGIAREAAATFGMNFCPPVTYIKSNNKDVNDFIKVEIENTKLCKRFCVRVVENIKIGPSPKWMRERLAAIGIRPINNLVDITNYVMEEYGQPMHAYDLDMIAGNKIIVKCAKDGEHFLTLDGQERKLDQNVLMICDGEKEIGIAGIMGGENSMVTDSIKTLVFESANFDGTNIRLSSKRIGLRTDASSKFEKGLDPTTALEAINRACQLIEELEIGEVVGGVIDVYPEPAKTRQIPFEPERYNALLGTQIEAKDMLEYFDRLGLAYDAKSNLLTIPTFRMDLECMADLAEEVARFYGYDNIPVSLPRGEATIGKRTFKQRVEAVAREIVERNGFSGAMHYSFESPKVFDKLLLPAESKVKEAIVISNPLGEDFSIMKTLSLNGMLTSLSTNFNRRNKSARLYELGKVYLPNELPLTELPKEKMKLTLGMYGEGDFFTLKGVLEELFEKLGLVGQITYQPSKKIPYLHPGRQAMLKKEDLKIGYIGQLHPEAEANYDMKTEVYIAVINMDTLATLASFDRKYEGIAKFPASTRDLSLVMNKDIFVGQVETIILNCGGGLLEYCELFDVYEGEQVGEGKKSVAYALSFRAKDRNLENAEVEKIVEKILVQLKNIGVSIRE